MAYLQDLVEELMRTVVKAGVSWREQTEEVRQQVTEIVKSSELEAACFSADHDVLG